MNSNAEKFFCIVVVHMTANLPEEEEEEKVEIKESKLAKLSSFPLKMHNFPNLTRRKVETQ